MATTSRGLLITLLVLSAVLVACSVFLLTAEVTVLRAVLFYKDGDPYWTPFLSGLKDACTLLQMHLRVTRLPDAEVQYLAYADAVLAEGASLCCVPSQTVADRVAKLPGPVVAVRSLPEAVLPPSVTHAIPYDPAAIFAALVKAGGQRQGRSLVLTAPDDPADYVPADPTWICAGCTADEVQGVVMRQALGKGVTALYLMDAQLMTESNGRVLREMLPDAFLGAAGCCHPAFDACLGYDAYEQGLLAGILFRRGRNFTARSVATAVKDLKKT